MHPLEGTGVPPYSTILAGWTRVLPYGALFVRVSLGFTLLNAGLAAAILRNNGGAGGGFNGMNPVLGGGSTPLDQILPYIQIALGTGLILGVFTVIVAIAAAFIALIPVLMNTFNILVNFGQPQMVNRMGFNPFNEMFLGMLTGSSTTLSILAILLAPVAINKFSLDALIFAAPIRSIVPSKSVAGFEEAVD